MKYVKQLFIIIIVSLVGELLHFLIPLPVPASIYGLVIMFLLLETGILKAEKVKDVSSFLLGIMPIFFIPPCVGFINAFPLMKQYGIQFMVIGIGTTILVMVATGLVVQLIMRLRHRKSEIENGGNENADAD
ncbi:MAG: CidA/LrgA family protein [Treponema sp.]|nr:CidA/LrgA family protein [Treponema sp.]